MHAKRTERKRSLMGMGVRVTGRDRAILHALGEMKFMRTSQIAALCFGRLTSTVRLRLRKLMDAGFLRVWLTGLDEENLYSLDRKGVAFLSGEDGLEEAAFRVPRHLERHLDHLCAINDFRLNLLLALRAREGEIVSWRAEWKLKKPGAQGLVPDALFRLRIGNKEMGFALEMDLGGEPAEKVFAAKLRRYAALRERPDFLLVVTATVRRLYALLETAAREPGAADFLFTIRDKTAQDQVLDGIWTSTQLAFTQSEPAFVSLLDLFEEGSEHNG